MLVDIVICTYNRSKFLKICLDALLPQFTLDLRRVVGVLIVDNNCKDDTVSVISEIQKTYPFVRHLQETKQGNAYARNCGAMASEAEYICYLDDDGKPGDNYLRTLVHVLESERPDFAGGPVFPYYLTDKPRWFKDEFEIRRYTPITGFIDCWISGANFIGRRILLNELGGFSPDFGPVGSKFRSGSERFVIELYRKKRLPADRRIYYCQDLFIYHYVPDDKMTVRYRLR